MNAEKNTAPNATRPPRRPAQASGQPPKTQAQATQENVRPSRGTAEGMPPMQSGRKRKPNPRLLARLRAAMLIVGSMILLIGLLQVLLPLFKLKTIEVKGNRYYSEQQVLQTANLTVGDEMLSIDLNAVRDSLLASFDHLESVTVRSNLIKGSIQIELVERKDVAYLSHRGTYYSFDQYFRVLDVSNDPTVFSMYPRVVLPEIEQIAEGSIIVFSESSNDMSYVFELIEEMRKAELLPYVTLLDCSNKYHNAVELNGNCRIEVGRIHQIPSKLELAQSILVQKGLEAGQCVVLDVSDMQKSTYRVLDANAFYAVG